MMAVGCGAIAKKLGVDFGAAFFRVLVLFENKYAGALGQYEAVTVFVEGP